MRKSLNITFLLNCKSEYAAVIRPNVNILLICDVVINTSMILNNRLQQIFLHVLLLIPSMDMEFHFHSKFICDNSKLSRDFERTLKKVVTRKYARIKKISALSAV
jgi:hypothetical protein